MRTRSISYGRRTSVGPGLSVGPDNLSWLVTARCCDVLLYRACLLVTVVRRRDGQRSNVPAVWIHLVPARVLGVVGYVRRRQCAQIGFGTQRDRQVGSPRCNVSRPEIMTTDRLAESTVVFRSGEREKTEREVS